MDKLKASLQTARQELGMLIAEDAGAALAAMASGGESADEAIRKLPQRFRDWRKGIQDTTFATRANNEEIRNARNAHALQTEAAKNAPDGMWQKRVQDIVAQLLDSLPSRAE